MRFRTLAIALALGFGLTLAADAKAKLPPHKVRKASIKKNAHSGQNKASKVRPRKAPKVKSHKA